MFYFFVEFFSFFLFSREFFFFLIEKAQVAWDSTRAVPEYMLSSSSPWILNRST